MDVCYGRLLFAVLCLSSILQGDCEATFSVEDAEAQHTHLFRRVPDHAHIYRRGASFSVRIPAKEDEVRLVITSGYAGLFNALWTAQAAHGIRADIPDVAPANEVMQWNIEVAHTSKKARGSPSGGAVTAKIDIPSSAPIGAYTITITVNGETERFLLVVLFNPWSSQDTASAVSVDLDEYVLNTEGLIWQGLVDDNTAEVWNFDQFEYTNLLVALYTLHRLSLAHRVHPAVVSRHLSYAVGEDLCYGRWHGSYSTTPQGGYPCVARERNCRDPSKWTGTSELFTVFARYRKRVQYCQCFIFSAVLTTIGRSLGIATRPVTTFQSAHDYDRNRAIDTFFQVRNDVWEPVEHDHPDSIWGFHVWNEMYFSRDDIDVPVVRRRRPPNPNGWQAVDATPQEMSVGGNPAVAGLQYQMGPASVSLTKLNANLPCRAFVGVHADAVAASHYGCYDTEFVMSMVNADVNVWFRDTQAEFTLNDIYQVDPFDDSNTIGQRISTKAPGAILDVCRNLETQDCSSHLDDITSHYKQAEPSSAGQSVYVRPPVVGETWSAYATVVAAAKQANALSLLQTSASSRLHMTQHLQEDVSSTSAATTATTTSRFVHFQRDPRGATQFGLVHFHLAVPTGSVLLDRIPENDEVRTRYAPYVGVHAFLRIGFPAPVTPPAGPLPLVIKILFRLVLTTYIAQTNVLVGERVDTVNLTVGDVLAQEFHVGYEALAPFVLNADREAEPHSMVKLIATARVLYADGTPTGNAFIREKEFRLCLPAHYLRSGVVCHGGGRWVVPTEAHPPPQQQAPAQVVQNDADPVMAASSKRKRE